MGKLNDLHTECNQSPWLDNISRGALSSGELASLVSEGVRGVTSNPTIFQKAISGAADYDNQFKALVETGDIEAAYWEMVIDDIRNGCHTLRPVYDEDPQDGYVSLEVAPSLAHYTEGTEAAARELWDRVAQPNLMVKIPGTEAGLPAIEKMISEGRNINVTLLFSVDRYRAVMEAYLAGLEARLANGDDLSHVFSVASFFISRVDTETDMRLEALGTEEARTLMGKAAVAQGKLAYKAFTETFHGERWEKLAAAGANVQRPLWASTSTKNPHYPELLYVETLIGPNTVNTLPDATLKAFAARGTPRRTVDQGVEQAQRTWEELAKVGVDMADVSATLEVQGVEAFVKSFNDLMDVLQQKAIQLNEQR